MEAPYRLYLAENKTIGILARLRHFVPTETLLMIYRSLIMSYLSYGICVWGRAPKSYISKLLVLQKCALGLIYFAPRDTHAFPLFIKSKILPVNMIYFDMVANLMHDIWKGLAPSPVRALFTKSNEIHGFNTRHAAKGNYIRKKLSWKLSSDVLFQELEQCYGIIFLQIGETYLNQPLRKKFANFCFRIFQIGMTMLKSTP